jgi:hypothetical protein
MEGLMSGAARLASIIRGLMIVLGCLAMTGGAHGAGGAYEVDDADIGKPGSCQNEAWASFGSNRDLTFVTSPACVVTVGLPVEFTALYQRTRSSGDWATALGLQAKAVPLNTDAIAAGWAIGTARDVVLDRQLAFVNVPVTFKFGKNFRIHANIGWLYDGRVDVHYATGGVGFDWDFAPRFSLMGEIYLQEGKATAVPTATQLRPQLGLRFIPIPTIDIDLIYGHNINGRGGDWITLGFTWRSE